MSPDLRERIAAERQRRRVEAEAGGWEAEKAKCAADILHWFDHWVFTYDPRLVGRKNPDGTPASAFVPFKLWPKQREFVLWLLERLEMNEEGLAEKSRDTGASYVCAAVALHQWLFTPGFKATFGSRKVDFVDKKDQPDSIFEKLRIMLRRMPEQLMPKGFRPAAHDNYMRLVNPENGATISGEGGEDMGRGGRSALYVVDEAAFVDNAENVEKALSGNTDCVIWVSTVNGMANLFANKRHKILAPRQIFRMHWRDDPRKTEAWAAAKQKSLSNPTAWASEYDIDYTASVEGVVIPGAWVLAAIDAHLKLGFGDEGGWGAALDVADGGADKNALVARKGVIIRRAEEWSARDTGVTARLAVAEVIGLGPLSVQYDCIGVGSGIKAEINRLEEDPDVVFPQEIRFVPWDAGAGVLNPDDPVLPGDRDSPLNKNFYSNLKAQGWWQLRLRFERTFRAINEGVAFDPDDLISLPSDLPNLTQLQSELSQPTYGQGGRLRLIINKAPDNTKSPNLGDATMMAFWPATNGFDLATYLKAYA